jgi:hypothetical protein
MKTIVATIIIATLSFPSYADWEWKGYEQNWCLLGSQGKLCLPSSYSVTEIGENYVRFDINSTDSSYVILEFHGELVKTMGRDLFPGDAYSARTTYSKDGISVIEYQANSKGASPHEYWLFVMTIEGETQLFLHGKDYAAVRAMSDLLYARWSP